MSTDKHAVMDDMAKQMLDALCRENGWSYEQAKREIVEELRIRRLMALKKAENEQIALAKSGALDRRLVKVDGDDLFETHRIHGTVYFDRMTKYGSDCWKDDDFTKRFLQKNPECVVRNERPLVIMGHRFAPEPAAPAPGIVA